jgi:hypothetical protein
VAHPKVAESAVVSKPHEIKGESVFAYVVLNVPRPEGTAAKSLIEELRGWVGEQLSPIAKPDEIRLTDNLPKTRSGKIMRRLLRSLARGEEITQDMSTLENPAILDQLRGAPTPSAGRHAAAAKPAAALPKAKKSVARAKTAKRAKAVKPAKVVAKRSKPAKQIKRGKPVKHAKRAKGPKHKVKAAKTRRAAAKAARRKPHGKK